MALNVHKNLILVISAVLLLLLGGCAQKYVEDQVKDLVKEQIQNQESPDKPASTNEEKKIEALEPTNTNSQNKDLVGSWRIYPSTVGYDGKPNTPISSKLELRADGTWQFESSNGKWGVKEISQDDWKKWYIEPYGPKRKIILYGWAGETVDGPIEETGDRVDFFWLIYDYTSSVSGKTAQLQLKFGH